MSEPDDDDATFQTTEEAEVWRDALIGFIRAGTNYIDSFDRADEVLFRYRSRMAHLRSTGRIVKGE